MHVYILGQTPKPGGAPRRLTKVLPSHSPWTSESRHASASEGQGESGSVCWLFLAKAVESHDLAAARGLRGLLGGSLGGFEVGGSGHRRHRRRRALVLGRGRRAAVDAGGGAIAGGLAAAARGFLELQAELHGRIEEALHRGKRND